MVYNIIDMIKNIIFDFDGVLAESVNVKTEAFRALYLPFGEEFANRVVEHHLRNGGVSRFEKFKIYHAQWLGLDVTEELMAQLTRQFSILVLEGVVHAPEVLGARKFLELYKNNCRMWIISGTPTEEMKEITKRRQIDHYFEEIFGSPTVKTAWTKYIIDNWHLKADETLFVGDAESDYDAAIQNRVHFILRQTEENAPIFIDFTGFKIHDLTQLDQMIQSIKK